MKSIAMFLLLLISFSCSSQNNQEFDITGNWYDDAKKEVNTDYSEIFIDNKYFHIFNEYAGFEGSIDYTIKNKILYFVFTDTIKKEKGIIKIIDKNTISIDYGEIVLKRITEGLKLEDIFGNNELESNYQIFFNKRMSIWKKAHNEE